MITSDVQICNLALAAIGTRSTIADLNEGSTEANACRVQYSVALDAVLQAAHWNFARKQIALTLLGDASLGDAVPAPWAYAYAVPSDMCQARYILPSIATGVGTPFMPGLQSPAIRFLISSDVDSRDLPRTVVLTNQPQATLVYTARITNVALFDGQFADAFANYLGARLAIPLTGDRAKARDAFQMAQVLTQAAATSNGNEGLTIIDNTPEWISGRGNVFDCSFPAGSMLVCSPVALAAIY